VKNWGSQKKAQKTTGHHSRKKVNCKKKSSPEEADTSVRRRTRYACLKLLNISVASITEDGIGRAPGSLAADMWHHDPLFSTTAGEDGDPSMSLGSNQLELFRSQVSKEGAGGVPASTTEIVAPGKSPEAGEIKEGKVSPGRESHGEPSTGVVGDTEDATCTDRKESINTKVTQLVYVTEEISSSLYDASLYMSLVCISSTSLHGGSEAKEMSATSSAEEYVVHAPTALEPKRLPPTQA
jgi:hypothetical protein